MAIFKAFDNPNTNKGELHYKDGFIRIVSIILFNNIPGRYGARIEFARWATKDDFILGLPQVNTFGYDINETEQSAILDNDGNIIRPSIPAMVDILKLYDSMYSEVKKAIYITFKDQPELAGGTEDSEEIK